MTTVLILVLMQLENALYVWRRFGTCIPFGNFSCAPPPLPLEIILAAPMLDLSQDFIKHVQKCSRAIETKAPLHII